MKTILLDTNALNVLSGLKKPELIDALNQSVDNCLIELSVSHIQIDERHTKEASDYQKKVERALKQIEAIGLKPKLVATNIGIWDVARWGLSKWSSEEHSQVFDELRQRLIEATKKCGKEVENFNISCDVTIAATSLSFDNFLTCDKILSKVTKEIFTKHRNLLIKEFSKLPTINYAEPISTLVATTILNTASTKL